MSTPHAVAISLRARSRRIRNALVRAEGECLKIGLGDAQELSSGPYSLKMLRQMGHPYAKRSPNPPMDEGVVNVQSGIFRASWQIKRPYWTFGTLRSEVYNASTEAGYLKSGPQSKMIQRPIWKLIRKTVERTRLRKLREALRSAIRG